MIVLKITNKSRKEKVQTDANTLKKKHCNWLKKQSNLNVYIDGQKYIFDRVIINSF